MGDEFDFSGFDNTDISSFLNDSGGGGGQDIDFSGFDNLDISSLLDGGGGQDIDFSGFDNLDISNLLGGDGGGKDFDFSGFDNTDISAMIGGGSPEDLAKIDWASLYNEELTPEQVTQREGLMESLSDKTQDFGGADVTKYLDEFNENFNPAGGFGSQWQTVGTNRVMVNDDGTSTILNPTTGETSYLTEDQTNALVKNATLNTKGSGYVDATGGTGYVPGGGKTIINADGTKSVIGTDGKVYTITKDGTVIDTGKTVNVNNKDIETKTIKEIINNTKTIDNTKKTDGTKTAGKSDNNMLLMLLALMAMMNKGGGSSTGSGAVIPSLSADRKQLPYGPTSGSKARPGAGGVSYFSPTTYSPKAAGGGLMSLAGDGIARYAGNEGSLVGGDAALQAYQRGDYKTANDLLGKAGMGAQDVVSKYGLSQADAATVAKNLGYAGDMSGIKYAAPPVNQTANVQNLPVTSNNNASNTSFQKVGQGTFRGLPIINPVDTETEINKYFTNNQNLVKNKDYKTIASDMYTSGWTPEMVARSTGTDVKNVSDLYNQTYGAFDRATQENLVKQKYKKQFGLTDAQLGEIGFGANLFSKEDLPKNIRLNNAYGRYQDELAAAGRYDAPADAYYRTKAIFTPEGKVKPDGTSRRSGRIELVDAVTGKPVTSFGAGQKSGQIFELLDKYGVDPASFKNAFKGAVDLPNNSGYRKDDYDRLMNYKAKNLASTTDDYLTKPLKNITRADLKHKYEKGDEDSKTNVFYLGEMKKQLRSKGLSDRESSDILSQFRNVSGLVNWAEISKSKDPLKAVTGTLNTLQKKGLINRRFAEGGISSLAQSNQMSNLGSYSDGGRLLRGPGDGVSDSIPATIGGKQPARLAEGEFVVPARIVSELGNGSTNAGAQKLYAMMDRVQNARRKTKNVAANTKAHKYLPA